jgi:hypothetical protein
VCFWAQLSGEIVKYQGSFEITYLQFKEAESLALNHPFRQGSEPTFPAIAWSTRMCAIYFDEVQLYGDVSSTSWNSP